MTHKHFALRCNAEPYVMYLNLIINVLFTWIHSLADGADGQGGSLRKSPQKDTYHAR